MNAPHCEPKTSKFARSLPHLRSAQLDSFSFARNEEHDMYMLYMHMYDLSKHETRSIKLAQS